MKPLQSWGRYPQADAQGAHALTWRTDTLPALEFLSARYRLVSLSNGNADLGVPFTPLIRLDVPTYAADALPPELAALPALKPGSRAS